MFQIIFIVFFASTDRLTISIGLLLGVPCLVNFLIIIFAIFMTSSQKASSYSFLRYELNFRLSELEFRHKFLIVRTPQRCNQQTFWGRAGFIGPVFIRPLHSIFKNKVFYVKKEEAFFGPPPPGTSVLVALAEVRISIKTRIHCVRHLVREFCILIYCGMLLTILFDAYFDCFCPVFFSSLFYQSGVALF